MVRTLISLRATVYGHQLRRTSAIPLILTVLLGLASLAGTLTLGFVHHARPRAGLDIVSAVFALWFAGQLAQAALAGGDAALRPQLFALLPVPRRKLAHALLLVGLLDPALLIVGLAYAATVPIAARSGPAAVVVALAATVLTLLLTGLLATVAGGLLGPGSRRGHDRGTLLLALVLSLLALSGTLLPAAMRSLSSGSHTGLVRALPSGWGADADAAASRHDWAGVAEHLGALCLLSIVMVLVWPTILRRRMVTSTTSGRARAAGHRRLLPATPLGGVTAKELRLWLRDPIRLTCLVIAVVVGIGVGVLPRVTAGTTVLMPFAGSLTVVIAGACACNLYGSDGTSLWLTVLTPAGAQPDVRGRQTAWLLVVAPIGLGETVLLTALSGQPQLWTWALTAVFALLGGAAGLLPLASLISVQPLDEAGNPTPAWSVKIHLALLAVAATGVPAVAVPVIGWWAILLGAATGTLLAGELGSLAVRRLRRNQVGILQLLRTAS